MDHGAFDALTRSLAGGTEPRRDALRLLAGSALGALLTRLGLEERADAKKKHGRKHGDKKRANRLHAAGKKRKKQKKKDKDRKPPSDPQPVLCDSSCQNTGGRCCADGSCIDLSECCPEQRRCPNACVPLDQCCPGMKECGDYCIAPELCCELDPQPLCNDCSRPVCSAGSWVCESTCSFEDSVCCQGRCVAACGGGREVDPETCECRCPAGKRRCQNNSCVEEGECCPLPEERRCANGACITEEECCPEDLLPKCQPSDLWDTVCCHGQRVCRGRHTSPTCWSYHPLGQYLHWNPETCDCECPAGYARNYQMSCCPTSHPHIVGGNCFTDAGDVVCALGYGHHDPGNPNYCVLNPQT